MMSKLQIISDKNKKSSKIKLLLLKKLNKSKVIIPNTIIVIGRHNGLKIRAFLECQFESGRGHH